MCFEDLFFYRAIVQNIDFSEVLPQLLEYERYRDTSRGIIAIHCAGKRKPRRGPKRGDKGRRKRGEGRRDEKYVHGEEKKRERRVANTNEKEKRRREIEP